jgi:hypothetical protein
MRKNREVGQRVWTLLLLLAGTACVTAQTSSASSISFQGALTATNGQALPNGNYNLTFKFYDAPTGGTALATSNVPNVPVTGGLASTAIPVDPAWLRTDFGSYGPSRYLTVSLNAGSEMSPRVLLTAVPYAMSYSGYLLDLIGTNNVALRFLDGADPSGFWTLQTEAFANGNFGIIRRNPAPDLAKSLIITSNGNVGIGNFPSAKLDVNGTVLALKVGIGTSPSGNWKLDVAGDVRASGPNGIKATRIDCDGPSTVCPGNIPGGDNSYIRGLIVENLFVKNIYNWPIDQVCVGAGLASQSSQLSSISSGAQLSPVVSMASIQELNQKFETESALLRSALKDKDAELEALRESVAELKKVVSRLAAQTK